MEASDYIKNYIFYICINVYIDNQRITIFVNINKQKSANAQAVQDLQEYVLKKKKKEYVLNHQQHLWV